MVSLKEEDSAINAFAWGWVDEGRCGYAAEVEATLKAQHLPRPCWPVTKAQMNRPLRCAAGYRHTLFATAKGHLKVCGSDTYGQLGVGGPRDFAAAEREKVIEVQHHEDDRREFFKSVAAGDGTSYALSASGTLFAWGRGKFGALGHGGKERDQPVPRVIERFAKVMISKVAAGRWHCLALGRTGKVYAWGRNHHGQLGSGDVSRCNGGNVVEVSFGLQTEGGMRETATCISAGETHSLSVMKVQRLDGSEVLAVFAWGCPDNGRLGGVDPRRHMAPQEIQSLSIMLRKKRISLSEKPGAVTCGGMHNIAITEPSGNLISWGYGGDGALGYGDVWDRVEPVMIGSIHSVAEVACGYRHTLAVRGNMTEGATTQFGELWAWGLNAYGELGLGDDNARLQPTLVRALQGAIITSVAAGHRHSVALTLGDVRKMRDDERYAEYYEILKKEGHVVYQILKRDMEQKGLDPAMLDVPDKAQPGQPGLTDCACAVSKFEPGMRYCKETAPEPTDGSSKWKSYETMYECRPCKLTAICGSCARICHKNHCVTAVFMRWRPTIDHCSCCIAKNPKRCKAQWSTERAAFDVLADEYDDCIGMDKIKQLLNALHGTEKEPVVSEEDTDAAEIALTTATGRIKFDQFEKWHRDYYAEKERALGLG